MSLGNSRRYRWRRVPGRPIDGCGWFGHPYAYGLALGGATGIEHVLRTLLAEAQGRASGRLRV